MGDFIYKYKCLVCGNSLGRRTMTENSKSYSDIFAAWKNECSTAICNVLLGTENCTFHYYLQNAEFCSSCQQIVRDIGFMWKQTKVIKNRISKLSARIRNRLNTNCNQIENKSEVNTINEKLLTILQNSGTDVIENIPEFSYEEIVELIHAATVLQHESQPQSTNEGGLSLSEVQESNQENKIFCKQTKIESIKVEQEEYSQFGDSDWQIDSIAGSPIEMNAVKKHGKAKRRSVRKRKTDFVTENKLKIDIKHENYSREDADEDDEDDTASLQSTDDDFKRRKRRHGILRKRSSQKLMQSQKSKRGRPPKQNIGNDIVKRYKNYNNRFYCKEEDCESSFTTEQKLKVHILKFHKGESKPYHCTKCPKKFSIKNALLRHSRVNHDNVKKEEIVLKLYCSFCGKRYLNEEDLTLHYSGAHQEPNPFLCAFCPEIYTNCADLKKHTKEFHPDPEKAPRCTCDICGKSFSNKYTLKYHSRLHGDQNLLYSCSICGMKFALKTWLNLHMENHTAAKYKCTECGKFFPHLQNLKRHQKYSHQEKGYECRICGETLSTLGKWERHEISHKDFIASQIKRSKVKAKNVQECKYCGKGYRNEEEVNLHYTEAHLGSNPFSCAFCTEIFSNSFDLRGHMKLTHPEPSAFVGKIKCGSCDRYFSTKQGLKNHSIVHGDPSLLFKCHLCSKVFIHRDFLKKHLLRHTEERKCICETCGKGYKNMDDLKSHLRYHDESEKKFQCKICEKKFVTSEQCKRHETSHTDIKEFICQVCGKAFNRKGNLTQHSKIHTGDGVSHIRRRKPKSPLLNSELQPPIDNFIVWNTMENQQQHF